MGTTQASTKTKQAEEKHYTVTEHRTVVTALESRVETKFVVFSVTAELKRKSWTNIQTKPTSYSLFSINTIKH